MLRALLKISSLVPSGIILRLGGLKRMIGQASIRMTFNAYVGLMTLASLISGVVVFFFSFLLLNSLPIHQSLLYSFFVGLVAYLISAGVCYTYPMLDISSRARKIEANMPLIANFMSVLASAGMPPERIFRSLANVGDEFSVGQEARRLIADVELMGLDLKGALKNAALKSPSKKFASMLEGVITTSHMGGDLGSYLAGEADKYKKARVQTMKSFLENLATIAEVYISFMIALPMALIVMLSVMSFMGGGAFIGNLEPATLLSLVTFVITPAGVGIILLMVDSATPPR